ncbi:hypothetical protein NP233_g374 [Leucocoprinus birnbaumii]|uniref:Uncharacterized protein n=1 Tax=Leucocoprinus birnbaumii TaxID=56174 RepID=A0AAD5W3U8_9AGAR|nr:hypothetical protein NP233_g374 [Leucocoprinus birnbaumii]
MEHLLTADHWALVARIIIHFRRVNSIFDLMVASKLTERRTQNRLLRLYAGWTSPFVVFKYWLGLCSQYRLWRIFHSLHPVNDRFTSPVAAKQTPIIGHIWDESLPYPWLYSLRADYVWLDLLMDIVLASGISAEKQRKIRVRFSLHLSLSTAPGEQ